jgi:uncharacterized membrane protein
MTSVTDFGFGSRISHVLSRARSSVWVIPTAITAVAVALAQFLMFIQPGEGDRWEWIAWPGDHSSAIAFLQVASGSVITVTSLTFSLVILALQLASQQFSPRLLREFARDIVTQVVLGILIATFAVSLLILRTVDIFDLLPSLALGYELVLVGSSVIALLIFVAHIIRMVRIDALMVMVHQDTVSSIDDLVAMDLSGAEDGSASLEWTGHLVLATRSGFVQTVDAARLVHAADETHGQIAVVVQPGDHVAEQSPLACVRGDVEVLTSAVLGAVTLGFERTAEQDPALGLRQLTDIAVKALSPSLNDPTTAIHALGHITDLLIRLRSRQLGTRVSGSSTDDPRVVFAGRDFRYFMELAIAPIRHYGARDPVVLVALMRMLRDVACASGPPSQLEDMVRQAKLIRSGAAPDLLEDDLARIDEALVRVVAAVRGDTRAAYQDRTGGFRST